MRKFAVILIVLMGMMSCVKSVFCANLTGFSATALSSGARLEFDVSGKVRYHVFSLKNPDRLVIDFKGVERGIMIPKKRLSGTMVKDIRMAKRSGNRYRVVLDLKQRVKASSQFMFLKRGQARLILTLNSPSQTFSGLTPKPLKTVFVSNDKTKPLRASLWPKQQQSKRNTPKTIRFKVKSHRHSKKTASNKSSLVPVKFSKQARSRQVIVVIDPGHGGKDPGATGPRGIHEKNIVLKISKKLYALIKRQPGFKPYLTRHGDYYITLRQRLAIARRDRADMFIAIHADAFHRSDARGASVYALSERGATSEAARWIAKRENASELMGGVDLADKSNLLKSVLIDLSQNATVRASLIIGQDIIKSLDKFATLHHDKVEQAAFVVLKSPDIPSLLVETGFISNPYEERRLSTNSYQWKIARALRSGIVRYFQSHPPRGTWLAEQRFKRNVKMVENAFRSGQAYVMLAQQMNNTLQWIFHANHIPVKYFLIT